MNKIISIILIVFVFSCKSKKTENTEITTKTNENEVNITDAQYKNAGIKLGNFEQINISAPLKVNGVIDVPPQNLVSITSPTNGVLVSTDLLPGMNIQKGQKIAAIKDQSIIQMQEDFLIYKNKYELDRKEYIRQKELNAVQATSNKNFQRAESEMKQDLIMIQSLDKKLNIININSKNVSQNNITSTINIYSTVSGNVSKVNCTVGKYITNSDILFEIINIKDIHLNLKIFEKDIPKIHIGQQLYAYTNSNIDKKYLCEIILIGKEISPNGTVEVHCHFDNYDHTLLPGTYMNATLETTNSLANSLPDDAIVNFEGKDFVFINEKGSTNKFELKEVKIGKSENGYTEILNSNEINKYNIVIKGAYSLLMKMKNSEDE